MSGISHAYCVNTTQLLREDAPFLSTNIQELSDLVLHEKLLYLFRILSFDIALRP